MSLHLWESSICFFFLFCFVCVIRCQIEVICTRIGISWTLLIDGVVYPKHTCIKILFMRKWGSMNSVHTVHLALSEKINIQHNIRSFTYIFAVDQLLGMFWLHIWYSKSPEIFFFLEILYELYSVILVCICWCVSIIIYTDHLTALYTVIFFSGEYLKGQLENRNRTRNAANKNIIRTVF